MSIGTPFKQRDIKSCMCCKKPLATNGHITFFRLAFQRMIFDLGAIRKQSGLEMMLGGHAALASVFSPNEDMAKPLEEPTQGLICEDCAMKYPLMIIGEVYAEKEAP